jgi:hypothetical protein
MTKRCELIDSVPGNIYQQKFLQLCASSLPENMCKYGQTKLNSVHGVCEGYVDNIMVSFHILNIKKINLFC